MENQSKTLKKIPISMSKTDFIKMYHPMPEKMILAELNPIIFEKRKNRAGCRNKTPAQIISTRFVNQDEILAFIEIFFIPDGYELQNNKQ